MSIKTSLIAVAAMALTMMGFASSAAAATDGVVRDVTTNAIIPENRELHFIGWTEWVDPSGNGVVCHVTSIIKVTGKTGTTGHVSNLSIPDTTKCTGTGALAGCKVKSHEVTNLPWHVTVTPTDFDVTGNIVIHTKYEGFLCPPEVTLTLSEITLKPLKTNIQPTTGTAGNIHGTTAAMGEPIAGVEESGTGTLHIFGSSMAVNISGELELTAPDRCTWKIAAS